MIIAQITDSHMSPPGTLLYGGYDARDALRRTLAALEALRPRPDIVLFTGDLADGGLPEEYAEVRSLLDSFTLPVAAIPGNHDRREAFAAAFAGSAVRIGAGRFLHLVLEDWPIRLIGLDTLTAPGRSDGALCDERLAWVAERLAEAPDRDTVIFMHHAPFPTGIDEMDRIGCANGARLAGIVAAHGRVLRVMCGHVHRPVAVAFGGAVATICPGIAWQVPLRLEPGAPIEMSPQPPAYQLHVRVPGAGLLTHTDYLPAPGAVR